MNKRHVKISNFKDWSATFVKLRWKIFFALIFLAVSLIIYYNIGNYLDQHEGPIAHDILLDRIPFLDMGWLFVVSIFFFIGLLVLYPLLFRLDDFPYILNQLAFMVLVRNFFMVLTPLSIGSDYSVTFPSIVQHLNFRNDLFFSGHVVIPLIGFLAFKDNKTIKSIFFFGIFLMAAVVLFTHMHYSVDVFAGLFIGYGCFKMVQWAWIKNS